MSVDAASAGVLEAFVPPVAAWFRARFAGPSPAQVAAWPVIRRGEHTLLLAPTGSGKTLAAFLCAIDALYRQAAAGTLAPGVQVLYVSPLKALGNDIQKNLLEPLREIRAQADGELPELRVAVRTGDTPQHERAAMVRKPPHILITTPESLFLLLQHAGMAEAMRTVRTVIVDEVHALCGNKRGVHLAVSLERLQAHVDGPLQRVGCSATLNPLEEIAAYLAGAEEAGPRPCTIVNAGMRKDLDVQVMSPLPDFLEASHTALWASAYELLLGEIARHRTTLIFANSRYKAERTALRLGEQADADLKIGAHHGSMAREVRLETEEALKRGDLQALVATSSLELGIDIGSVDIVYQLESPKSISAGVQRIGRAGHLLHATSKGRMLLFERDELPEAAVICKAMLDGEVDAITLPRGCLDVLAQHLAGAVALESRQADDLFALVRRAYPYRDLSRADFDRVLSMLAGEHPFQMAHPPRALLLWDRAAGRLSPARSTAQVTAQCVGTIPESTDYEVVIHGSNKRVGTVHNEFVDDNVRTGDVFVLGSTAWRAVGKQRNRLLVEEAPGATPTVPWWLGTVDSRTREVGVKVGALRRAITGRLADPGVTGWLRETYHLCPHAATALVDYIREQYTLAGVVPDDRRLLVETWRDELGRLNVILHTPFGYRINRTWGLALAEAALRLSQQHWAVTATNDILLLTRRDGAAAPLRELTAQDILASVSVENALPLLEATVADALHAGGNFRDTAACALQILRTQGGKRVAPWLQNLRAAELYAAAQACPDYPVLAEVRREYLHETLDVPGLQTVLDALAREELSLLFREVESPSPFAHGVLIQDRYLGDHLMGRDRRAHLLHLHRQVLQQVLSAEEMAHLLDPRAIERLEERLLHQTETARAVNSDELAQALRDLGDLPATVAALQAIAQGDPLALLQPLLDERRVVAVRLPSCEQDPVRLLPADAWQGYHDAFALPGGEAPALLLPRLEETGFAGFDPLPVEALPAQLRTPVPQARARLAILERYLKCRGPVSCYDLMNHTGWPIGAVEHLLETLVNAGTVAQGVYTDARPTPQWVNRVNLEEIHRLTMSYLKRELAACASSEVVDFLTRWQHLHPDTRLHGLDGLRAVIRQLQGVEVVQGVLEREVLPGRVADYRPELLDRLLAAGEVVWRRVSTRSIRRGMVTLCLRTDAGWLANGSPLAFDPEGEADCDIADSILTVRRFFRERGPAFFDEVLEATGVEEGAALRAVWHLVWCGELTCDTYECLRHAGFEATLSACYDLMNQPWKILHGRDSHARVLERMQRRRLDPRLGRWSPTERLRPPLQPLPEVDITRRWVRQLLERWGILSRDILAAEDAAPAWSALLPELKRLELLGQVQRGYFIADHQGEQYGLPEAVELLRACRARRSDGRERGYLPDEPIFTLSHHDPANLYATCLRMVNEDGEVVERSRKLALATARAVVQAGQPLLLAHGLLLVMLTTEQLTRCVTALQHDAAGAVVPLEFKRWNNYPIDSHPVRSVLRACGLRLAKGAYCWPPPPKLDADSTPCLPADVYLPYQREPEPTLDGPAWARAQAPEAMRPLFGQVLRLVEEELDEGWSIDWLAYCPYLLYRGVHGGRVECGTQHVTVILRAPGVTGFNKCYHFPPWGRVADAAELTDDFRHDFQLRKAAVESAIAGYLGRVNRG